MIAASLADRCVYSAEPSPEEKLQKLHTDIKFALRVDNPVSRTAWVVSEVKLVVVVGPGLKHTAFHVVFQDIDRCLQALDELNAVPVTSQILHKNAEVIATLKKVPPHVSNETLLAEALYSERVPSIYVTKWTLGATNFITRQPRGCESSVESSVRLVLLITEWNELGTYVAQ